MRIADRLQELSRVELQDPKPDITHDEFRRAKLRILKHAHESDLPSLMVTLEEAEDDLIDEWTEYREARNHG